MRAISKSKLMAFRQCPKRLWLELHQPTLRIDSAATQASYDVGNQVGDIARKLYDPAATGTFIDIKVDGMEAAFAKSEALLKFAQPIFEAGFSADGALAFSDVLLPTKNADAISWRMIEVKSSTSVKEYHRDDVAVQAFIAKAAQLNLSAIALAHIDSAWIYPGDNNYSGLLVEVDLTEEAFARGAEVKDWIAQAHAIALKRAEPKITTGEHCNKPYACGFLNHCQSQEPAMQYPISWLPGAKTKAFKAFIGTTPAADLRDVPDALINEKQQRVKAATLSNTIYFDQASAKRALAAHKLPAYFIDFETIQFAVPIWQGTRPYQQLPFQFSVHQLSRTGEITHRPFLDLSGNDPSLAFAQALIVACDAAGDATHSIFVYNAPFEKSRISDLAIRYPHLAKPLAAINARVVDLLPIARDYYYHPSQQGSWSIKAVLPAVCPDLTYENLEGVKDGGMAMQAYLEAIAPQTLPSRKAEIEKQLLAYCALDTYAMIRLWSVFSGNTLKE